MKPEKHFIPNMTITVTTATGAIKLQGAGAKTVHAHVAAGESSSWTTGAYKITIERAVEKVKRMDAIVAEKKYMAKVGK